MVKPALTVCLLLLLAACASQEQAVIKPKPDETDALTPLDMAGGSYYVDLPRRSRLTFYGQVKSNEVNSAGASLLYPGGDAASFFVSIAMHAAIQKSVTDAKAQAQIDAANSILGPYQSLIEQSSLKDLIGDSEGFQGLGKNPDSRGFSLGLINNPGDVNGWHTVVDPVFIMSRSQDSITIKSQISILDGRIDPSPEDLDSSYSRTLFVQSLPVYEPEKWLREDGRYFEHTVIDLLRSSVDLAVKDFAGLLPAKQESTSTIRYVDNGGKKIERGYLIEQSCTHLTFESLRGEIKSMPRFEESRDNSC
jgi:hypothetical protein